MKCLVPAVLVALVSASSATAQAKPGVLLRPGWLLTYSSGGQEAPPWSIEGVTRDTTLGDMPQCTIIQLRTSPTQTSPEVRAWCVRADSLFAWDAAQQGHRLMRPVGPNMSVTIPSARGGSATYVTGAVEQWNYVNESISIRTSVLPTEVVTRDSTGRVVRRLRERYALSLATAVAGVFEVPDSTSTQGWREERAFSLTRIAR